VNCSRECTPPYLFIGISNLLQPAQEEVVLGQFSTYLASWDVPLLPTPIHTLPNILLYICEHFANFIRELLVNIASALDLDSRAKARFITREE
jgi:hypothetical protein